MAVLATVEKKMGAGAPAYKYDSVFTRTFQITIPATTGTGTYDLGPTTSAVASQYVPAGGVLTIAGPVYYKTSASAGASSTFQIKGSTAAGFSAATSAAQNGSVAIANVATVVVGATETLQLVVGGGATTTAITLTITVPFAVCDTLAADYTTYTV